MQRRLSSASRERVERGLSEARAHELAAAPDEPCVLIWAPDDPEADRLYYAFENWDEALSAAIELDRDTSGDWFIEPLRSWPDKARAAERQQP